MRLLKFALVGGAGIIVNSSILYLLTKMGMYYLFASTIATETAIVSNFIGNYVFTFDDKKGEILKKFAKFQIISLSALLITISALWILTTLFGIEYLLIWNLIAILLAFLVNFSLNVNWTWSVGKVKA